VWGQEQKNRGKNGDVVKKEGKARWETKKQLFGVGYGEKLRQKNKKGKKTSRRPLEGDFGKVSNRKTGWGKKLGWETQKKRKQKQKMEGRNGVNPKSIHETEGKMPRVKKEKNPNEKGVSSKKKQRPDNKGKTKFRQGKTPKKEWRKEKNPPASKSLQTEKKKRMPKVIQNGKKKKWV